jgi:hypothetical protein
LRDRFRGTEFRPTFLTLAIALLFIAAALLPLLQTVHYWPDHRPIGQLFLSDYSHSSPTNPRGWFNRPADDFVGAQGRGEFRHRLLAYADRSIAVLCATGSQGVIVWDIEGQQYPQKISYIGDPRLIGKLAPEMQAVVDEFFSRFRRAGLRVGLTIRPQQLVFDGGRPPRQENADDYSRLLLEKIDYSRRRWGATLFYLDSNGGVRWPLEAYRLQKIARQRPDVLIIPEHHDLFYYGFSAPYVPLKKKYSVPEPLLHIFYPRSSKAVSIADVWDTREQIETAYQQGSILMFPASQCGPECRTLQQLQRQ